MPIATESDHSAKLLSYVSAMCSLFYSLNSKPGRLAHHVTSDAMMAVALSKLEQFSYNFQRSFITKSWIFLMYQ